MNRRSSQRNEYQHMYDSHPGVWRYELGGDIPRLVLVQEPLVLHDSITAAICGDPLPGRRALDRVPAPPVAPMQATSRQHSNGNGARIRSPRELRRMKAMAAHTKGVSE